MLLFYPEIISVFNYRLLVIYILYYIPITYIIIIHTIENDDSSHVVEINVLFILSYNIL